MKTGSRGRGSSFLAMVSCGAILDSRNLQIFMEDQGKASLFPYDARQFAERIGRFRRILAQAKRTPPSEILNWYPYDTLASLDHMQTLLQDLWPQFERSVECGPVLDIGCGDGDLAMLFASMGCRVCAVDHPPTNSNWMLGVRALQERLGFPVEIREMDVDSQFCLTEEDWGLVLLLGILYHLKNPFHILEQLALRSRYCLLSTRIARQTVSGLPIQSEPVAYLLDHREANDDPTNYWIFSETGLLRLVKRAGWRPMRWCSTGNLKTSNPRDPDADERMFLFLRSQMRSADAKVTLLDGWTEPLVQNWAWTLKRFRFEVQLQSAMRPEGFLLGFVLPDSIAKVSAVTLACRVNEVPCGSQVYRKHGDQIFESKIPESVDHTKPMVFEFSVEHSANLAPDPRDLGVIMPFTGAIRGISERILFWLD